MRDPKLSRILNLSEVMSGSGLTLDEAIAVMTDRFPRRSVCIVADWFWVDLEAPGAVNEELIEQGKQPVMLLASDVLFDSSGANRPGEWLRSTPLVRFTDAMFFETEITVYLLMGHGRRHTMSLSTMVQLF